MHFSLFKIFLITYTCKHKRKRNFYTLEVIALRKHKFSSFRLRTFRPALLFFARFSFHFDFQ